MGLPEQQEYMNQISLIKKKLLHLEETLKIENEESQLMDKIYFHRANSAKEAALQVAHNKENAARDVELEEEESQRHRVIDKMVKGDSLSPIKDALIHFEGNILWKNK